MSDAPNPGTPPPSAPSGARTAITFLLILGGIVLLLPGVCSLAAIVILIGIDPNSVFQEGALVAAWIISFIVGVGGVLLIRHAIRRNRNPRQS
jgi:hypothetical protein